MLPPPGAGYDQCNIPDCTKAGIHVSNTPAAVDAATADTALFLMLGALRMFASTIMNLRKGEFRGKPPPPLGHDPEGKMLGIVGMGGIGRDFKKKAEALGMKVQYHNRSKLSDEMSGGAKYVGFEELLESSDVISLNVPLNVSLRLSARDLCCCLFLTTPFSKQCLLLPQLTLTPEIDPSYDFNAAILKYERWRCDNQHCSRRHY